MILSTSRRVGGMLSVAVLFALIFTGCAANQIATTPQNTNDDATLPSSPGDVPLNQQASQAYINGDYARSVELYSVWLHAQPGDASSWYNFACSLALNGQKERALAALNASATAGFSNVDHCMGDPDLASFHEEPEFIRAVDMMRETQKRQAIEGDRLHYFQQTRYGRYLVYLPENTDPETSKPLPVILFLHGRTQTPQDFTSFAERMNSEGFAVILPEAPYAIDGYRGGFEYWPTGPGSTQKIDGEILQEHARFDVSTMYLDVLKDAAVYAPLDLDRVVVSGFSMGATTSYSVVQQAPEAVIGAAIFAGMIRPGMNDSSLFTAFKEKGGKILIMHGEEDRPAFAKRAEALVREAGVDVQFKLYPETGHTVTDAMIEDFVVWVHGVVGQ